MQLSQIRGFGRPIVHLRIDVHGVFAVPWRKQMLIPDPLKVGRLSSRPGRCDQQVAPILEVETDELRVTTVEKLPDPLVGGLPRGIVFSKIQNHPIEQTPVIGDMICPDRIIVASLHIRKRHKREAFRVAPQVPEVVEIRSDRHINHNRIRVLYGQPVTLNLETPALQNRHHPCLKVHPTLFVLHGAGHPIQ